MSILRTMSRAINVLLYNDLPARQPGFERRQDDILQLIGKSPWRKTDSASCGLKMFPFWARFRSSSLTSVETFQTDLHGGVPGDFQPSTNDAIWVETARTHPRLPRR